MFMEKKKSHKLDVIIIAGMVAIGFLILAVVLLTQKEGETVIVEVAGAPVASFPLTEERTYIIEGKNGGTNTLMIKDGCAWIGDASCPDGLCKHMGKIHDSSHSIICLPNEVVVRISGGEDADIDATIH